MRRDIVTSLVAIILFTVLLGVLYPLAVTGVSQVVFPGRANGSQIHVGGRLVGSRLIGQRFVRPRYFQSRPSGTVPPYNAGATAFSNLGPNDKATREAIEKRVKAYLALERPYAPALTAAQVPVDAANSSASGIDPDISLANARIQAHRVADVRHLTLARVTGLISEHTDARTLGVFGEPGVNVLELNLALDRMTGGR